MESTRCLSHDSTFSTDLKTLINSLNHSYALHLRTLLIIGMMRPFERLNCSVFPFKFVAGTYDYIMEAMRGFGWPTEAEDLTDTMSPGGAVL